MTDGEWADEVDRSPMQEPHSSRYAAPARRNDILVLDGQCRQALACARTYGQAGLEVAVAACENQARFAPAYWSRWATGRATLPDMATTRSSFVDGLIQLLDEQPTTMVLPAHDGSIEAIRPRRTEIEMRAALPLASEEALSVAVSKERTLRLAADLGLVIPRDLPLRDEGDLPAALDEVGLPAVIKPVQSWVIDPHGNTKRISSALVRDAREAREMLEALLSAGGSASIQGWLPGRREAVTLFYAKGTIWARFAQVSHREWPVLGGVSAFTESIPLLKDITEGAERLVEAMNLEGCSMVEYRRDREGRPVLMEVNPRMGGTVSLAVRAGVNFPELTWAWATGGRLKEVRGYRVGMRVRWLTGDLWYLKKALDRVPDPDLPRPGAALATFLTDFVRRPGHFDLFSITDPMPALAEMRANMALFAWPRARRWLTGRFHRSAG